jgi:hypothetical protein
VVVGLHTCGDLGPALLRIFAQAAQAQQVEEAAQAEAGAAIHVEPEAAVALNPVGSPPRVVGLVSLGCCYHLMSERGGSRGGSTLQDPVGKDASPDTSQDASQGTSQDTSISKKAVTISDSSGGHGEDFTGGEVRDLTGGESPPGFPMSDALQPLAFGEAALGLAAQALARWVPEHSPPDEMEKRMRAHFYR